MSGKVNTNAGSYRDKVLGFFFFASLTIAGAVALESRTLEAANTVQGAFRLTPSTIALSAGEGDDPAMLIDRATNTTFSASGGAELIINLGTPREISAIKLFGPAPYLLAVKAERSGGWETMEGLERLDLRNLAETWHRFETALPVTTGRLLLVLSAQNGSKAEGLKEIEIWGKARGTSSKSARDLLDLVQGPMAPDQGKLYAASPAEVAIGGEQGNSEGTFSVTLDREPSSIRRAWLVFESQGAGHWISTQHALNGGTPMGGNYFFASSAWTTQLEPLAPSQLIRGANTLTFQPFADGLPFGIRNVQLLVELDNGANLIEQIIAQPNTEVNLAYLAADGDTNTGWTPYPSGESGKESPSLTLQFDKPTVLETMLLSLRNRLDGRIEVELLNEGEWKRSSIGPFQGKKLGAGENRLAMSGAGTAEGVRLVFVGGEGSSAEITEVQPIGSGEGYTWGPAIRLAYPLDGEYYGGSAYVRAFVQPFDNGSGPAVITVAGSVVESTDGAFEALVSKAQAGFNDAPDSAPWSFDIEAVYPDGQRLVRTVQLYNHGDGSLVSAPSYNPALSAYTGSPYQLEHDEGSLDLDGDSMDESPATLTISSLDSRDLPPLDPGMTNVTKGPRKGYRFGPHGKKFKKNIQVKLPYDKNRLPPGMTEADIRTYYFDEETGHWRALERVNVDDQKKEIVSHTNHFTDMINATLVLPEHPEAAGFNPTQIKDIKAADPGAGINLIEPPQASSMGDANLSYPIEIPAGRNGMQPQLVIQYNSGGGNGWLGLGWDVSVPSITVDSRWGVPRYLADKESETYLLGGEMLSPTAHRAEFVDRVANREYQPRIEGQFRQIIRHGNNPKSYWWEVVDNNGNRSFYGATPENTTVEKQVTVLTDGSGNIFRWQLLEQRDAHGNTVKYQYGKVDHVGNGGDMGWQLYPTHISYTGFNGGDGPYTVDLIRDRQLAGADRKDIIIDARGGFKQVTADLLRRIEVKFNGEMVRVYGLEYEPGVFGKTRLKSVAQYANDGTSKFNQHHFTYYDDVDSQANPGKLAGTDPNVAGWTVPSDNVRGDLIAGSENISLLGGSEARASGGNLYLGIAWPTPNKGNSAGDKEGTTTGSNTTLAALMDMDGDGLADKVYKDGGALRYRKNLGGATSGEEKFSDVEYPVSGISDIGRGNSSSRSSGPSVNFGVSFNVGDSSGTNTQSTYFSDINGDGISDQINGSLVKFGYIDSDDNKLKFSQNSVDTEVPLYGSRALSGSGLISSREELHQQMLDDNPLIDVVRVWVAPYNGVVDVTGEIALVESNDEDRVGYPADGVRVAIQQNQSELWHEQIGANSYTPIPTTLTGVPVSKGDRFYFRAGSINNGEYDQVKWAPVITYHSGSSANTKDVNGLPVYQYSSAEDFVAVGRDVPMTTSYDGTITLEGSLEKLAKTSDDVAIELRAVRIGPNGEMDDYTILYNHVIDDGETGIIELTDSGELSVKKNDFLYLTLRSDSEIDLKALSWAQPPTFRYLSAYREGEELTNATPVNPNEPSAGQDPNAEVIATIPAGTVDVSQLRPLRLFAHADTYSSNDRNSPYVPWQADKSSEVLIRPRVTPPILPGYSPLDDEPPERGYLADGEFNFTVKRQQQLVAKQSEMVKANQPFQFNRNGILGDFEKDTKYYFDFSTRTTLIGASTAHQHSATVQYMAHVAGRVIDDVPVYESILPATATTPGIPGTSVAANSVIKFTPVVNPEQQTLADSVKGLYIIQTVGTGDEAVSYTRALPINAENISEYQHLVFDVASSLKFYYLADEAGDDDVLGLNIETYSLSEATTVASRLNWERNSQLYGDMYRNWGYLAYNGNDGRETLPINEDLLKFPGGGKNADLSQMKFIPAAPLQDKGNEVTDVSSAAIGKDRWIVGDELWWILPDGVSASRNGLDRIEVPSDAQYAGAVGVVRQSLNDGDTVGGGALIFNYNTGTTDSSSLIQLMDLNGDKFADVVSELAAQYTGPRGGYYGGLVTNPFALGDSSTDVDTISAGGSILPSSATKTKGGSEPSLGVSIAYNNSETKQQTAYIDMNGDGLPDRVDTSGSQVMVRLNYGYGFAGTPVSWGSGSISTSKTKALTPSINPGWATPPLAFGGGFSVDDQRPETLRSLMDMNGDGLVDEVSYTDNDITTPGGDIYVAFNNGIEFLPAVQWATGVDSGVGVNHSISHQAGGYASTYIPLCITPVGVYCWIVINPGVNTSKTVSRQEVQWSDINGDGYPDYLVSKRDDELRVRYNQTKRTNLLKRVERPLGASFTLDYARTGNTYEQPQSRWVLSRVELDDGVAGDGPGHITRYSYSGGYNSRIERDFYGFSKVVTEQLGGEGKVVRGTERRYHNDSYYTKGLLKEEITRGHPESGNEALYRKTRNSYRFVDLGTDNDLSDLQSLTAVVWPRLERTDRYFYEGSSATSKSTYTTFAYDTYGNVTGFFDAGDSGSQDDVQAVVTYSVKDATCRGRNILAKATTIKVYDTKNKLLRRREGKIDCGTQYNGSMTELRQYLANDTAVHTLDYDQYGNLTSLVGPKDDNNEQTSLAIAYDEVLHTYPETVTNHFGLSISSSYDYAFGKKLGETDTNGNSINYTLDKFGRIETVTGPYQQGSGHTTIAFDYHPETAPPHAITRHYDGYRDPSGQDTIDTVLFTDGLKRVLQTKKDAGLYSAGSGVTAKMIVSGRVKFDALGRTIEQYQPTSENVGALGSFNTTFNGFNTLTDYDVLDRTTRVELPDGSVTHTDYDLSNEPGGALRFHTTVTDAEGNKRESFRDVRELITTVREHNESEYNDGPTVLDTRYAYDPLKQITDVYDAEDHHTSVGYDLLGRRTAINNPDTGLVEYAYDITGNLRYKLTPNLRKADATLAKGAIEYRYDHERLVNILYPNAPANDSQNGTPPDPINVSYIYGENMEENARVGRVGRIIRVDHQSGYEERWYGKLGEVVQERKWVQIPGDLWHSGQKHNEGTTQPEEYEVFTTQYEYDTFGRLQNMVFPDGEQLTYHYNAGGLPESVSGTYKRTPYEYVTLIGYDEYEQRVHVELGNGAVTNYSYDPKLRRLATLKTQSLGYRFQDLSYSYDKVGNITGLLNDVDPPSTGMGGYVSQTFDYDGLYRLSESSGTYMGDLDSKEQYTLSMRYDGIHNITRKNQKHWVESLEGGGTKHGTTYDWHYAYKGSQPHAPTNIGVLDAASGNIVGRTFSYDANGNQEGWTNDKNANRRNIEWDDENRIQSIDDKGQYSQYSYDDQGQRVIKQSRQNLTVYVNQYFTERNGSIGSKHIFVGSGRVLTKVTGGTLFIRSYDGVTGAKTPPGQVKSTEKSNNGKAVDKEQDKTNNGKHLGQQKNADKGNNSKANGKSQANNNTKGNASSGKTHGVNGLEHRSDRANEVAQNTCKNKHLRDEYCDGNNDGIPDSQEGADSGADGVAADETFMEEIVRLGSQGEQLFFYHSDHLGSTGYVTRENGELHEHIQYFPFGETWVQQGGNTEKDPYLFTGKELDEETGLYYFGARYYDPRTSVWVSADPILGAYIDDKEAHAQLTRKLGLYAYGRLNPLIYLDPDGKDDVIFYYNRENQPNFQRAAETLAGNSENEVRMIGVQTESDFVQEWQNLQSSGVEIDNMAMFFHGSKTEGGYKGTTDIGELNFLGSALTYDEAMSLGQLNFKEDAQININACLSGLGDKPIAEAFARGQGVTATGLNGNGLFSTNASERGLLDRTWFASETDSMYLKAYDGGYNNRFFGDGSARAPVEFSPKQ